MTMKSTGRKTNSLFLAGAVLILFVFHVPADCDSPVKIGSKKFTESVILGELLTQLVMNSGVQAVHRRELGGTRILWKALLNGDIDAYTEYTGTLIEEIFSDDDIDDLGNLVQMLKKQGILVSRPLGFENTYILGMKRERAAELDIDSISDLRFFPDLKFGFSNEFIDRGDGWPSLKSYYKLPHKNVRGLDHDIAYRGLESGSVDVIDLYSTDADILYYDIRRLQDDLNHFPMYKAVILYRKELKQRYSGVIDHLLLLEGLVSQDRMTRMNRQCKLEKQPENRIAAEFLRDNLSLPGQHVVETVWDRLLIHTGEHILLVLLSLTAAILVSIPLGIVAARYSRSGQIILGIVGIIQTIPSLALLVFMIPLLGIGGPPALMALFLYSLLPIVRNTHAGLNNLPVSIRESARALGLPYLARLTLIELPIASRTILAGIKTSAVINVGTATLGALIGAGGYGQPILTGIRLDDMGLILQGAVPAAGLALLVQFIFNLLDRFFIPRGLRLDTSGQ
jgi:osmoprotectant transport system permease protein